MVDDDTDGGRERRELEIDLMGVAGVEVAVRPPEPSPPLGEDKETARRRSAVEEWDEVSRSLGGSRVRGRWNLQRDLTSTT